MDPDVIDTRESVAAQKEETMQKYAVMSDAAYNFYYEGKEKTEDLLKNYLPLHSLDEELSDPMSVVVKKGDEVTIAYRGTDPSNPKDLATDITDVALKSPLSSFGYFDTALQKYDAVKAKYGNDARISTTGHSLGGSLAFFAGKKKDVPSFVYNMGSSPFDLLPALLFDTPTNRATHYYVPGDPISTSQVIKDHFGGSRDESIEVKPKDFVTSIFGKLSFGLPVNLFAHSRAHFLPDRALEKMDHSSPIFESIASYVDAEQKRTRFRSSAKETQRCIENPYTPKCSKAPKKSDVTEIMAPK